MIQESLGGVRGAGHLDRDLTDENLAVGKNIPDCGTSKGRDWGVWEEWIDQRGK